MLRLGGATWRQPRKRCAIGALQAVRVALVFKLALGSFAGEARSGGLRLRLLSSAPVASVTHLKLRYEASASISFGDNLVAISGIGGAVAASYP